MTEQEIINSNKLIAEFMGGKMIVTDYHGINIIEFPDKSTKDLHGLNYHKSFDWLMDVVQKIESLSKNFVSPYFVIHKRHCVLHWQKDSLHPSCFRYLNSSYGNNRLDSVWKCCVDFIKWFNTVDKTNLNESK